jgi:hypothetical protein
VEWAHGFSAIGIAVERGAEAQAGWEAGGPGAGRAGEERFAAGGEAGGAPVQRTARRFFERGGEAWGAFPHRGGLAVEGFGGGAERDDGAAVVGGLHEVDGGAAAGVLEGETDDGGVAAGERG